MKKLVLPLACLIVVAIGFSLYEYFLRPVKGEGPFAAVSVTLNTMWCNKTTEGMLGVFNQHDEVYLLLVGKKSDGEMYEVRLPDGSTWSFQGSGGIEQELRGRYPQPGWTDTLSNLQSVELTFYFMEEDGGSADEKLKFASRALKTVNPDDPRVGAVATAADLFGDLLQADTDDFLGSLSIKVTNVDGQLEYVWQPGERAIDQDNDPNGRRFDFFERDGGYNYFTTWNVNHQIVPDSIISKR